MVLPTPFERLLQDLAKQAQGDAPGAWARIDEAFGKTTAGAEVQQLAGIAIQLGAGGLGRFDEVAAFLRRCLDHPALAGEREPPGATARSLWRGLGVVLLLAGREADAEDAANRGISGDSERVRFLTSAAHMLAVRQRPGEAAARLRSALPFIITLPAGDEVVGQAGLIASTLMRHAEQAAVQAHDLLLAAAAAGRTIAAGHPDWRASHQALFHEGQALCLAGRPVPALASVQAMMELEDAHQAGPLERFFTAALAARAQALRGQPKVAAGALEACQDFAKRIEGPAAQQVRPMLAELERVVRQA